MGRDNWNWGASRGQRGNLVLHNLPRTYESDPNLRDMEPEPGTFCN